MKKHATVLFLAGLLISVAGFMLGQASRIPFVLRIISPAYSNAMFGYEKLSSVGELVVADRGFKEIAEMKLQDLSKSNPPELMKNCHIIKFTCEPGSLTFFTGGHSEAFSALAVTFHLSNGQSGPWNGKDIKERVGSLKEVNILLFASLIFVAGLFIQIASWWLKKFEQLKTNKNDPK